MRLCFRGSAPHGPQQQAGPLGSSGYVGARCAHASRGKWRFYAFADFCGVLLLRNPNYPGSESRARIPALVQVRLDSAYFQAQYTEHPSCGLQARVGPARSSLAIRAPRRREPSRNSASVPISHSLSARSLPASLLSQGGDVVTYFKDFLQPGIELETEGTTTAALRSSSRPPHRAQHRQLGQARKFRHVFASFSHRLHHPLRRFAVEV